MIATLTKYRGSQRSDISQQTVCGVFISYKRRSLIILTEDVLKARLKTLGVVEHTFTLHSGNHRGVNWKIYDVGGARNQRQAWAPYFEDGKFLYIGTKISHRTSSSKRYHISGADLSLRSGSD